MAKVTLKLIYVFIFVEYFVHVYFIVFVDLIHFFMKKQDSRDIGWGSSRPHPPPQSVKCLKKPGLDRIKCAL